LIDTPVVVTGGRERMVGLISVEAGTTVEEEGCQKDDRTVDEGKTEETEEEGAGAEKFAKNPATEDSTLYSTSIVLDNFAGRGPKKTGDKTEDTSCLL